MITEGITPNIVALSITEGTTTATPNIVALLITEGTTIATQFNLIQSDPIQPSSIGVSITSQADFEVKTRRGIEHYSNRTKRPREQ